MQSKSLIRIVLGTLTLFREKKKIQSQKAAEKGRMNEKDNPTDRGGYTVNITTHSVAQRKGERRGERRKKK
jgi:hypothetical protein